MPATLPDRPDVPLIGLPFEIKAWHIHVLIVCKCGDPQPVLLVGLPGTAQGRCAGCGKTWVLQDAAIEGLTTSFKIGFAL